MLLGSSPERVKERAAFCSLTWGQARKWLQASPLRPLGRRAPSSLPHRPGTPPADSTRGHAKAPGAGSSTLPGLIPSVSPLGSGKVETENAEAPLGLRQKVSRVCGGVRTWEGTYGQHACRQMSLSPVLPGFPGSIIQGDLEPEAVFHQHPKGWP